MNDQAQPKPDLRYLSPDTLGKPLGQYSHITRVRASELLFIAGQVAVDGSGALVGANDFQSQCAQVFANIEGGAQMRRRHLPQRG
jgi:enamine deaminase RidA (YjgF/YER057c/UK114 family)